MSDLIWLSERQMERIAPYFPLSHGIPRVDDRRIISGIIFVLKNGLRWRDAPKDYGPHRRSTIASFAGQTQVSIRSSWRSWLVENWTGDDRRPPQSPRTAASLLKGRFPDVLAAQKAG